MPRLSQRLCVIEGDHASPVGATVRARFCNRSTRLHYPLQQTAAALPSGDMKKSS
jgi:hypothetical protein